MNILKKKYPKYFIEIENVDSKIKIIYPCNQSINNIIELNSIVIKNEINRVQREESATNMETLKSNQERLNFLIQKNKFIKQAASYSKNNDKIFPIKENNNSVYENSIIFVYFRKNGVTVLIENENPDRSAYLFFFLKFKYSCIKVIKGFLESDVKNKRQILQSKTKFLNSIIEEEFVFRILYHKDLEKYEIKIRNFLNQGTL